MKERLFKSVQSCVLSPKPVMDYECDLSDIIQLDGPADDSDAEEEGVPLGENDFLRMINAEAINVDESGDGSSASFSSSASEGPDELDDFKEEEVRDKDKFPPLAKVNNILFDYVIE